MADASSDEDFPVAAAASEAPAAGGLEYAQAQVDDMAASVVDRHLDACKGGSPVEAREFEDRIERRLRDELLSPHGMRPLPTTITVDDVRVEGRYPDANIVVLFRDGRWPGVALGFAGTLPKKKMVGYPRATTFIPMLTWAYLVELIEAAGSPYPGDLVSGEVKWFSYSPATSSAP